tara:strand:+ start:1842 stop:2711 length:870 start_codon:yes stop_codon:yes gene_type:complete
MIIVLGSEGQLGQSLKKTKHKNTKVVFFNKHNCDITKYKSILRVVEKYKPNFIINAAAFTNLPLAEKYKKKSFLINSQSLKNICKVSKKYNFKLIHISTDYVFDGKKNNKYSENDKTNPLSWYGFTKLEGEKNIIKNCNEYIILRTSGLFSSNKNSFVYKIIKKIKNNENINVVSDQFSFPCYSNDLAKLIWRIINKNKFIKFDQIYNYTGHEKKTNWYNFANKIMKYSRRYCKSKSRIMPIKSINYKDNVKRPINSCLSNKKINKSIYLKSNFDKNIRDTVNNIFKSL